MRRGRATAEPRCAHGGAVPVESIEGETVAKLCTKCDTQLPADFQPSIVDLFYNPALTQLPKRRRW